tara:strand:- start:77 stop:556 length:480 start_codon:yes stop_codon:yes gene_type:complete
MKITKSRLKEIINEEYRTILSEQEMRTVGDLRAVLNKIQLAKKTGDQTKALKTFAVDTALEFTGISAARNLFDLVQSLHDPAGKVPPQKTDSPLKSLQVDPEVSKIVDDTVEDRFLDAIEKEFENLDDNAPLNSLDMTKALQKYIGREYDNRSVSTPED